MRFWTPPLTAIIKATLSNEIVTILNIIFLHGGQKCLLIILKEKWKRDMINKTIVIVTKR
jgi:hypothetical protein